MLFIVAQAFNLYRWEMTGSTRTGHCFFSSVPWVFQAWLQGRPNQAGWLQDAFRGDPLHNNNSNKSNQTNKKQPIKCKACPRKSFCKLLELAPLCHTWMCFFIPLGFDCNVSTHGVLPLLFSPILSAGRGLVPTSHYSLPTLGAKLPPQKSGFTTA